MPQNFRLAAQWFRKSAEQGNFWAQFGLGLSYKEGIGVPQNNVEAIGWFRKAANQGYEKAQHELGVVAYSLGETIPENYKLAAQWWRKAAEQGEPASQFGLGLLYFSGKGVNENLTESYIWVSLAKAGLSEIDDTPELTQGIDDLIEALLSKMTIAQVERAQDIALVRFNKIKARKAQD